MEDIESPRNLRDEQPVHPLTTNEMALIRIFRKMKFEGTRYPEPRSDREATHHRRCERDVRQLMIGFNRMFTLSHSISHCVGLISQSLNSISHNLPGIFNRYVLIQS
ncbi:unnamed protein product [Microthlaspi erraticum]|uniref:Uncharacterized protein n=1 Tax=Microthlaspi erraticum TaxID=1685480 RepID=A0A6D2JEQ1_9BRAS|nr:unnamed protein product [Microthlaspi erraticum]CAA7038270.1 unnamed protein product [Microthlaspi erraticum]